VKQTLLRFRHFGSLPQRIDLRVHHRLHAELSRGLLESNRTHRDSRAINRASALLGLSRSPYLWVS